MAKIIRTQDDDTIFEMYFPKNKKSTLSPFYFINCAALIRHNKENVAFEFNRQNLWPAIWILSRLDLIGRSSRKYYLKIVSGNIRTDIRSAARSDMESLVHELNSKIKKCRERLEHEIITTSHNTTNTTTTINTKTTKKTKSIPYIKLNCQHISDNEIILSKSINNTNNTNNNNNTKPSRVYSLKSGEDFSHQTKLNFESLFSNICLITIIEFENEYFYSISPENIYNECLAENKEVNSFTLLPASTSASSASSTSTSASSPPPLLSFSSIRNEKTVKLKKKNKKATKRIVRTNVGRRGKRKSLNPFKTIKSIRKIKN